MHGRVRRYEEHVAGVGRGRGRGREQRGGRADGDGGPGQQGRVAQRLPGAGVGVGVGDDDAVDQFGAGGEHACVVGGVDGLGEVAPAGEGGDAVLAEELDGGQHVRAGRQQPAVAEGAEDAGVVRGGGAQLEQLPLGGGHRVVQQLAQLVGEPVEFLRAQRALAGAVGRAVGVRALSRYGGPAFAGGAGQAQQFREPLFGGEALGGAPFALVGPVGGHGRVGGAGGGQLGAALGGGRLTGVLGGAAGGLAGGVPGGDGGLLGVAGREGGAGGVGVGGAVVEPAGADGLGGLLLDLGEPLPQVADLAAGALRLGGGGGGVAVGGVVKPPGGRRTAPLLVGEVLGVPRGGVQGADEVDGGLGACGEGRGGVALGLLDGGGDAGDPVGGGAVPQHGLGGLPGGVQGARVGQFTLLRGGGLLGGGERQRGVPVGEFGGDGRAVRAGGLGPGDRVGGGGDALGEVGRALALLGAARGEPPGEGAGAALGGGVDLPGAGAGVGGLDDPAEQVHRPGGEVAFGDEFGALSPACCRSRRPGRRVRRCRGCR